MELPPTSWVGPTIDDQSLLRRLPDDYAELLRRANGFIAFGGALHVRGICREPEWHSLQHVWSGELALSRLFESIKPNDIPFAQSALADQFILRGEQVWSLGAGEEEPQPLEMTLEDFLASADRLELVDSASLALAKLNALGDRVEPGQAISVYPPFIFKESANGVSLRAVPALQAIEFYADMVRQIAHLPDGSRVKVEIVRSDHEETHERPKT